LALTSINRRCVESAATPQFDFPSFLHDIKEVSLEFKRRGGAESR